MSVPVYRRVTGSANKINVPSVYRHTVCNCERASDPERRVDTAKVRDCKQGYMVVVVAEGKCVWLYGGGGFWPLCRSRGGKIPRKAEERGSPLARDPDSVALHTGRIGHWGQSLSDTFLFMSKALASDDSC